jgi:CHAD domain-containing protein
MVEHRQDPPLAEDAPSLPVAFSRLSLPADEPVAIGIIKALRGVVAYADQCAKTAEDTPHFAVHEFRKSVRRARAMCRLLEDIVDADVVAVSQDVLRAAQLATSTQRDTDVLPHVLRRLPLPPVVGASVALRLFTHEFRPDARAPAAILLRDHADAMTPLVDQLADAMPERVRWRDIARGIRMTYRRARRALAKSKGNEVEFHRWRKRNKELVYQLELLAIRGSGGVRTLRRRHAKMSERLGDIVDLMVVRDRLAPFADAPARDAVATVEEEIAWAMRKVRKRGKKLYASKPRRFSRQVVKSARAARKSAKKS